MMAESQDVGHGPAGGVGRPGWTHVLTELTSMDDLGVPLRGSARLRYTCIAVSRRYIALGANTGAVYIFGRESLKHLQVVLAERDSSPVTQVCFGPLDNLLGYACSNGNIMVVGLNIERRSKPERVRLSVEHSGASVTALQWDTTGGRLFAGDNLGKISVAFVPASKAKDLFQHPSEGIVRLDSAIVQLDWSVDRLLVSTVTRCYICYTSRQQYSQIGKRLRDGRFGACFYPGADGQTPSIYCARPGSRVWEVDFDGTVLNTHQFKQLLAIPSFPVITAKSTQIQLPDKLESGKAQSVAFPKLLAVSDTFLFTWALTGLYVLDPVAVKVITWTKYSAGTIDVRCYKNEVYIFTESTGQVQKLVLLPVQRCVGVLIVKENWLLAGHLCAYFDQLLLDNKYRRYLPRSALTDLYQQLVAGDELELAEKVQGVVDSLPEVAVDDSDGRIIRLNSGIYKVNDGKTLESDEDSLHTPTSSEPLSRQSSTSSLLAMFSEQIPAPYPKPPGEFALTGDLSTQGGPDTELVSRRGSLNNGILVNSTIQQSPDIEMKNNSEDKTVTDVSNSTLPTQSVQQEEKVGDKKLSLTAELLPSRTVNGRGQTPADGVGVDEPTDGDTQPVVMDTDLIDEKKWAEAGHYRKGSASSLSSLSSNEVFMDQPLTEPIAMAAGKLDSGKKTGRKKKASHPVIQDPREKLDSKGSPRRSLSTSGAARKHNFRRRAKSDLGPRTSIQEAILEVVQQEAVSAGTGQGVSAETEQSVSAETKRSVSAETEQSVSAETEQSVSAEAERSASAEVERSVSAETEQRVSEEMEQSVSADTEQSVFADTKQSVSAGKERSVSAETERRVFADTEWSVSAETERSVLTDTEQSVFADTDPKVFADTEQPVSAGLEQSVSADVEPRKNTAMLDQTNPMLPLVGYTSWAMGSSSPINNQETSPSQSPLMDSWEGLAGQTNITGPKTALKSVKDSLSSKLSSTKKNLMRTIREKKTMFVSRESSPSRRMSREESYSETHRFLSTAQVSGSTDIRRKEEEQSAAVGGQEDVPEELSALYEATRTARLGLDQADALLQPRPVLTVWLRELHLALQQLRSVQENGSLCVQSGVSPDTQTGAGEPGVSIQYRIGGSTDPDRCGESVLPADVDVDKGVPVVQSDVLAVMADRAITSQVGIPSSDQPAVPGDDEVISDTMPSSTVKDLDTVSLDSGHPLVDGQSEDAGSDLDVRLSVDQEDASVSEGLSISEADYGAPASSYSSGTSDSFADSPRVFQGDFRPNNSQDTNQEMSKIDSSNSQEVGADMDWLNHCYVSDLFHVGPQFSADITYLANICFELGLHGHLSQYILPQKGKHSSSLTATHNDDSTGESDLVRPGTDNPHPVCGWSNGQLNEQEDDRELALFVRNYFSYLDINRVTRVLSTTVCPGYIVWMAVLDCFREVNKDDSVSVKLSENNTTGAFDLLRSGIGSDPAAVLGHLPRLFSVSPSKTLEFCLEEGKHIRPLDMLNMSRYLNKPLQHLFLPYMLARHSALTQPGDFAALCENPAVRLAWVHGLLADGDRYKLITADNQPAPGSHLYGWKHKSIINRLLDQFMAEDGSQLLEICQDSGYWLGSLQMLHHLRMRDRGLELVVRLRDITLLASEAWYPVSLEEWQRVLDMMVCVSDQGMDRQSGVTSPVERPAWSPSLTWDSLGLLLAQSVGAQQAISLLQALPLPPDSLTLTFYQGLIVATLGAKYKRSLLHNVLEKTDAYLWAKKPTQMAPQLHYAVEEERKTVTAGREGRHTQVFKDMFTQLESQADRVTHRFVEDPECHWGVRCDFNRPCPCCGLQLSAQVSASQPGVLIFHCGHGYHKFCHQEKVCQVCGENRSQLPF